MYPTYVFRSGPCAGRHVARRAPQQARALSGGFFPPAVFSGGRHHPFFGSPANRGRGDVFDHFDEFVNRSFEGLFPGAVANPRTNSKASSWHPRFDVREVDNAYQLRGELPGVEAQDLSVEFTDANALVVRGQTQSENTQGKSPAQNHSESVHDNDAVTNAETVATTTSDVQGVDNADAASVHSESSYIKPSVEDEAEAERRESVGAPSESTADAAGTATSIAGKTVAQQQQDVAQEQPQQSRYWVSERSTGSFSRVFEFPGRVDAENVTASLKNGILDVTVPKAKAPEARKIEVN